MVEAWHSFPFFTLLLLAGLKGIPTDLYKAADVDGAGPFAQLRLITLPMLRTIIAAAVILRVIGLVNSPDLLLILTSGGPGRSTQVLSLYAFQTAYKDFNFGYAGALSVVMFVLADAICLGLCAALQSQPGLAHGRYPLTLETRLGHRSATPS